MLTWINKRLKHNRRQVFLYCNLSFRDNNRALYDYMIAHDYNKRYKIVVSASDYKDFVSMAPKNVTFVGPLRAVMTYFSSKWIFYCIGKLPIEPADDQYVIHMEHGMPFKDASEGQSKYNIKSQHYTNVMATGKCFVEPQAHIYGVPLEKIFISGNPKCDSLYLPNPQYDFGEYTKLVLWAPTFRKSTSMNMQDTMEEQPVIPIVDVGRFGELNGYLKKMGVKIVVKLHPEQDLSKYDVVDMDYFILLSHQEFLKRGMELYRFMKQCDAMITDYSSIFYDFLLLDRPIGFTEDDIDDYADKRGFAMDPDSYRPGMRLRSYDDICLFIKDLVDENDCYKADRDRVNSLVNEDMTGDYSRKVLNFVGL
ncbi:CDP-glycerol glycerophosphotransferase family protein [Phocaeicola dorei]|uniref:CDP-glycerol glycerophosphotransferase family protein n=1 Tax=Phocaeicola dorei TaxID=357276 RepID=UPI00293E1E54|nr:CDP-glycerol glycerophosphotransferase family protein [Phocaeicola dorei]